MSNNETADDRSGSDVVLSGAQPSKNLSKNQRRKLVNPSRSIRIKPHQIHKDVTGLVLCMIVKNESKIIHRCLDHCLKDNIPIITGICITDTGSMDNTKQLIKEWSKEKKLPYSVLNSPFNNFGYARTKSFLNARQCFPDAGYYLLIDADMQLVIKDSYNYDRLNMDRYTLYQQNGSLRYQNTRIIKANLSWVCEGVTHEYWDCKAPDFTTDVLTSLEINDRDDGGAKADKYDRDIKLLQAGMSDPKTDTDLYERYLFYMAQSYSCRGDDYAYQKKWEKSMEDYNRAIYYYSQRASCKEKYSSREERWYSLYQIGRLYFRKAELHHWAGNRIEWEYKQKFKDDNGRDWDPKNDDHKFEKDIEHEHEQEDIMRKLEVASYLQAWNFRPHRAEPLYRLAEYYRKYGSSHLPRGRRNNGDSVLALHFALLAKSIGYPYNDSLFIDHTIYSWGITYEIMVSAWYVEGKKALGYQACRELLSMKDTLPPNILQSVMENEKFYQA